MSQAAEKSSKTVTPKSVAPKSVKIRETSIPLLQSWLYSYKSFYNYYKSYMNMNQVNRTVNPLTTSAFNIFGLKLCSNDITLSEKFEYLYDVYSYFLQLNYKSSPVSKDFLSTHTISITISSTSDNKDSAMKHHTVSIVLRDLKGVPCYQIVICHNINTQKTVSSKVYTLTNFLSFDCRTTSARVLVNSFINQFMESKAYFS